MVRYYICKLLLDGRHWYVLWYSTGGDGVVVDNQQKLCCFESTQAALEYAEANQLATHIEETNYDFDRIHSWCDAPDSHGIDCKLFLNTWNMLHDMANSQGDAAFLALDASDKMLPVYEKLFFGNNLPSITPDGQHYEPTWNRSDLEAMAVLFQLGIQGLRRSTHV